MITNLSFNELIKTSVIVISIVIAEVIVITEVIKEMIYFKRRK